MRHHGLCVSVAACVDALFRQTYRGRLSDTRISESETESACTYSWGRIMHHDDRVEVWGSNPLCMRSATLAQPDERWEADC